MKSCSIMNMLVNISKSVHYVLFSSVCTEGCWDGVRPVMQTPLLLSIDYCLLCFPWISVELVLLYCYCQPFKCTIKIRHKVIFKKQSFFLCLFPLPLNSTFSNTLLLMIDSFKKDRRNSRQQKLRIYSFIFF